jgi:hypothetical protein
MTQTKIYTCCLTPYPATLAYFADSGRYRDGLKPYCLTCLPVIDAARKQRKKERSKAWAAANREKERERVCKAYQKNRDKRLEYMRQWRRDNRQRVTAY